MPTRRFAPALVGIGLLLAVSCAGDPESGTSSTGLASTTMTAATTTPFDDTTISSGVGAARTTTTVFVSTTIPSSSTTLLAPGNDVRVIDGDTFDIRIGVVVDTVRLIGINAPEDGECFAAEAMARLDVLLAVGEIELVTDVSERDRFGRLLRYVHVDGVFVNEVLVSEGFALAVDYPPDLGRSDVLASAQEEAQSQQSGLWHPAACGKVADIGIEVGKIHYDAAGDDGQNLNDEWVDIVNGGESPADLTGYTVKDESASHRFPFPDGFNLGPSSGVRIHSGCGENTGSALYWCNIGSAIWNNSGDTVFVLDPAGTVVDFVEY